MTGRLPWTPQLQALVAAVRRVESTRDPASQLGARVDLAKLALAEAVLDAVREAEARRWLPRRAGPPIGVQLDLPRGRRTKRTG